MGAAGEGTAYGASTPSISHWVGILSRSSLEEHLRQTDSCQERESPVSNHRAGSCTFRGVDQRFESVQEANRKTVGVDYSLASVVHI